MSSFHISASKGQIAETVLLPGDPLRAKFVAENFLSEVNCYNQVRGMLGFTGIYKGQRISIQGSGMGMGSISIYAHELINTFNVQNLIRVGTCGAFLESIEIGDVIMAMSAAGDSDANSILFREGQYAATADFELFLKAYSIAQSKGFHTHQGIIFSTNSFYDTQENRWEKWIQHGVLAVDMETQALYTIAKRFNRKALSLLTVSDNVVTNAAATHEEREKTFNKMMEIALELT